MRQLGLTQEARCAREVFAPCSAEARAVTGHAHTRWGEPGTRGWKDLKAAEAMGFMLSAPGRTSGEDEGGRDLRKATRTKDRSRNKLSRTSTSTRHGATTEARLGSQDKKQTRATTGEGAGVTACTSSVANSNVLGACSQNRQASVSPRSTQAAPDCEAWPARPRRTA